MRVDEARRASLADPGPETEAALIAARVRAGELELERVKAAALLGHEGAALYTGLKPTPEEWRRSSWRLERIKVLHRREAVLFAADCAERVLPLFEERYPEDKRPREAIDAARAWAKEPTEENRKAASSAASSAAASAAASADSWSASWSADSASWSAAWSASSAAYSAASAAARDRERAWQRNRLCDYLLGEVSDTRPGSLSPAKS